MSPTSKYTEYRKKWRAASLTTDQVETKVILSKIDHEKVVAMSQALGARIPIVMGKLISSGIAAMSGRQFQPLKPMLPPPSLPQTNLLVLCLLIDKSRFKGDTGSARYRQIAFVNRLAAEATLGNQPTILGLAQSVDSHYSQIELLSKVLEVRGIISRPHVPGLARSRSGRILLLRDDAIEAFNQAHIEMVGTSLLPLINGPATD